MRLPIGLSVLGHLAILLAATQLPAVRTTRALDPIEIDVRREAPRVEPMPPVARVAPVPVEPQKRELAMRPPQAARERARPEREREPPSRPESTPPAQPPATPQPQAEPPSKLSMRAPPRIDLQLHALPGGPSEPGEMRLPVGPGGGSGPPGATGPQVASRKAWKPKIDAGNPLTGKVAEQKEEEFPLTSVGREGFVYKGPQFSAHIALDGTVSFDDKIVRDFKGLSGTFDPTDWIMKGRKEDPYRYQKQKFLAATTELRDKLARQARARDIESSLASLPSHLDDVWSDRRMSPRRRREMLFQIWKEAAEAGDERADAGAQARRIVEQFVRSRLPEGSPDAYTDDELASLNHGDGKQRFEPYR